MANLIKLANGGAYAGVFYSHAISSPNEEDRDVIWGGDGDDVIFGDNETWNDYPPDFGIQGFRYDFGGVPYFLDAYYFRDSDDWADFVAGSLDAQDGYYYFSRFDPATGQPTANSNDRFFFDEVLAGRDGNDYVYGLGGNDWIVGGLGNDHLYGGDGNDLVDGGKGDDVIDISDVSHDFDVARGGRGDDQITVDLYDYADGGQGGFDKLIVKNVDQASSFDLYQNVNGTSFTKNFEILEYHGSDSSDTVKAGSQNDTLYGNGGNDTLDGRFGNDKIYGGDGFDIIHGGSGVDIIDGGAGTDIIYDDEGDDIVNGGDDADIIYTGEGNDTVHGGEGDDVIDEAGKDSAPSLRTHANDILYGDAGTDKIFAGTGDDIIDGGADNDLIVGGLGLDIMKGGTGADNFRFRAEDVDAHLLGDGTVELTSIDRIRDFSAKDNDVIDLSGLKSLVPDGKLYFDHVHNGVADAGEVVLSELNGNIMIDVYLDSDSDVDVQIELTGLNFATANVFSLEQLILI